MAFYSEEIRTLFDMAVQASNRLEKKILFSKLANEAIAGSRSTVRVSL